MKYQIIGKNIEITEGISSVIQKKMSKMDKYFLINEDVECRAVCSAHTGVQKVEITIFLPSIKLRAEVENEDLYAAIDLVSDKLERQIRKNKTKARKNLKQTIVFNDFEVDAKEDVDDSIVKRKTIDTKPMSEEEAILQMELIGHEFFAFKNVDTGDVNIIYKRKDGDYGIMELK